MSTDERLAEVRGLIRGDPSLPTFLLRDSWMRHIREAVEEDRVGAVLDDWRRWYSGGDSRNGDHRDEPPSGYTDLDDAEDLF